MKSLKVYPSIIICSLLFPLSCKKEKYVTVRPVEYEHALNNPLKGFRNSLGGYNQKTYQYSSIQGNYIKCKLKQSLFMHHLSEGGKTYLV